MRMRRSTLFRDAALCKKAIGLEPVSKPPLPLKNALHDSTRPIGNRVLQLILVLGFVVCLSSTSQLSAQTKFASSDTSIRRSTRKVATQDPSTLREHPLWPTLELAVQSYKHIRRNVRDYSCDLVRQERVHGELLDREFMTAKVRHRRTRNGEVAIPFGVYLKVLAPSKVKGREVLYVEGQNDDDMLVRNGGKRFAFVTTKISPTSDTAMNGNRYPLTEFGLENLVKRLIEVVQEDIKTGGETTVQFFNDASIDGRRCTGIRVTHPNRDRRSRFHTATVFVDDELNVPVHYEAYTWPKEDGGEPLLLEKYTYRNIKLNVGFTNRDFDPDNPNYGVK